MEDKFCQSARLHRSVNYSPFVSIKSAIVSIWLDRIQFDLHTSDFYSVIYVIFISNLFGRERNKKTSRSPSAGASWWRVPPTPIDCWSAGGVPSSRVAANVFLFLFYFLSVTLPTDYIRYVRPHSRRWTSPSIDRLFILPSSRGRYSRWKEPLYVEFKRNFINM